MSTLTRWYIYAGYHRGPDARWWWRPSRKRVRVVTCIRCLALLDWGSQKFHDDWHDRCLPMQCDAARAAAALATALTADGAA